MFMTGPQGCRQKKNSIFTDIVQIDGDPPPSYPIFDKFIFDKLLTMLTSPPALEIWTKIMKLQAFKLTLSIIPITF